MSKGGFSISAAHAGRPRRAMYLQGQRGTCVQTPVSRPALEACQFVSPDLVSPPHPSHNGPACQRQGHS